ncbi:MAG: ABC transporter ATP-binding protein [Ruminococcaceae bacterium]|nr:ABC transporter ATP-binding protein [Oscillospiraceae bacterium]
MDTPILSCEALSKSYGASPVLENFYLALSKGEIVGLLGPNGSGKTTLIKLIAGLLTPNAGKIEICGVPPSAATCGIVSYLPDRCALPQDMTTVELVRFYARMFSDFDREKAETLLRDLRVSPTKRMKALSKGTREKVLLILTMSRRARLYLLDEPIGGVDPATRDYILKTILSARSPESTILISTHLIADVEPYLDSFFFLSEGVIVAGGSVAAYKEDLGTTLDEAFRRTFQC